MNRLRIGTRGSALALWQANAVAAEVRRRSGRECELVVITTTGDRLREANLSRVGGKRVFVKEIEQALVGGEIDLAVHSAKDLPAELPDGLAVAAVLPRADPRDAVVLPAGAALPPDLTPVRPGLTQADLVRLQGGRDSRILTPLPEDASLGYQALRELFRVIVAPLELGVGLYDRLTGRPEPGPTASLAPQGGVPTAAGRPVDGGRAPAVLSARLQGR